MNNVEALGFLENHQPMPGDLDISQEQCDSFMAALKYFRDKPDKRCIPLFVNCVSKHTGMGMYEVISDVFVAQDREEVVSHLKVALKSGSDAIKFRCCWWATDIDAWELVELIGPLISSQDDDLREAALYYIKLKNEIV